MEKTTPATTDINAGSAALKRLVVVRRLSQWFWNVTHNGLAMAGIALLSIVLVLASQSSVRVPVEEQVLQWLQGRQEDRLMLSQEVSTEPRAADRVNVTASSELPDYQAALSRWISRTYRVASPPINVLIAEAYAIGERTHIDPALLLSIAAVESRFNPYARSPVGAEGLMQVLTRVHLDKFEAFGGPIAAFDPITNLRVGTMVLQECIARSGGTVELGLSCYVGAVTVDGSFYLERVIKVYERMQSVLAPYNLPIYKQTLTLKGTNLGPAAAIGTPATMAAVSPEDIIRAAK
jgi:hypothetical protein